MVSRRIERGAPRARGPWLDGPRCGPAPPHRSVGGRRVRSGAVLAQYLPPTAMLFRLRQPVVSILAIISECRASISDADRRAALAHAARQTRGSAAAA